MDFQKRYYYDPTRSVVVRASPGHFFVLPDDVHTLEPVSMADSRKYFLFGDRYHLRGTQVVGCPQPGPSPFRK